MSALEPPELDQGSLVAHPHSLGLMSTSWGGLCSSAVLSIRPLNVHKQAVCSKAGCWAGLCPAQEPVSSWHGNRVRAATEAR